MRGIEYRKRESQKPQKSATDQQKRSTATCSGIVSHGPEMLGSVDSVHTIRRQDVASTRYRMTAKGPRWQVRYRDPEGTQRSETFADERGATEFSRLVDDLGPTEALAILGAREAPGASGLTLRAWAAEFIDTRTGITEGTRERYRLHARDHLGRLGSLPVDAVTGQAVKKWVLGMEREGLSGKTISNRHGFLSAVMKEAVREGMASANPCDGTRLPRTERQEMCYLTPAEFAQLMPHVRADAADLVLCLPSTGLRFGEISALQVRDVDLEAATLTVSRAWKYAEGEAKRVLGPPKTSRSRRTIALPSQVVDVLAAACAGKAAEDFVFTNTAGRPWTGPRFHTDVWQPATRAAQPIIGKKPRVHDMRHTCASWMLRAGIPLQVVQRHLGHESITTTVDRYGHLEPSALTAAAAALSGAMSSAAAPPQIGAAL